MTKLIILPRRPRGIFEAQEMPLYIIPSNWRTCVERARQNIVDSESLRKTEYIKALLAIG